MGDEGPLSDTSKWSLTRFGRMTYSLARAVADMLREAHKAASHALTSFPPREREQRCWSRMTEPDSSEARLRHGGGKARKFRNCMKRSIRHAGSGEDKVTAVT